MGRRKIKRRIRQDEPHRPPLELVESFDVEEPVPGSVESWLIRHNQPRYWAALGCGIVIYAFLFFVWRYFANI